VKHYTYTAYLVTHQTQEFNN